LLSLLATAVYLSIPVIAGQALKAILNTMGPTTVMRYLNFAIGGGIGIADEGATAAAVGLENVAEIIKPDDSDDASLASGLQVVSVHDHDETDKDVSEPKEAPVESDDDTGNSINEITPSYFYGGVSNKVGEGAACWLARWGGDILSYEDQAGLFASTSSSSSLSRNVPTIWARGGLDPVWVRAVLSSDMLFVRGERERYDMAKTVVELRRRNGIDSTEEAEFDRLFTQGIYYMHMVRPVSFPFCSPKINK
jgi:hypothetical protein